MVEEISLTTLGTLLALVAPAYGALLVIVFRQGTRRDHNEQIESNSDAIQEIKLDIQQLAHHIKQIRRENRVLHDNIRDKNHCGSEHCEWCDPDDTG